MIRLGARITFGAVSGVCVLKAVQISANDDWDSIIYDTKKLKKAAEAFGSSLYKSFSLSSTNEQTETETAVETTRRRPKVVVLGAGWGALSFIQKLDQDEVDLVIVSPRSYFFYTPLLAGTATGTVAHTSITEPIRWYCERSGHKGATFIQAECTSVDLKKKMVLCRTKPTNSTNNGGNGKDVPDLALSYDHLVISVGAEPATFGIPGVKEYATFMKELEDGLTIQKQILQKLELASAMQASGAPDDEIRKQLSWIIIGGGPTGVELTAELTDFVKQDVSRYFPSLVSKIQITLIEATDRLLGVFDRRLSSFAQKNLQDRGADVLTNAMVTKITQDSVDIKVKNVSQPQQQQSVQSIKYGAVVWAGGITVRPFIKSIAASIGKEQNSRFGLLVDGKLRVKGIPDGSVWAIGDCADSGCAPTAQAANQQGKYLGRLFRDTLLDKSLIEASENFRYVNKGSLAYTGGGTGVAELKSLLDNYPTSNGQVRVEGSGAYAIWRSLYFSKLLSNKNQAQVLFDWTKASLFGREISTPFILLKNDTPKK